MNSTLSIPFSRKKPLALITVFSCLLISLASNGETNKLTNGDFETGDLSGWTASGSEAVVSGLAGSTFAADLNGGQIWQDFYPGGGIVGGLLGTWTFSAVVKLDDTGEAQRLRLRGGPDNATTDIITMKMGAAGLYEFNGASWGLAVAQPLAINTEYHIRAVADVPNNQLVYGLSTDGVTWTDSAVYTSSHGALSKGFETVVASGNMVVDQVTVIPDPSDPDTGDGLLSNSDFEASPFGLGWNSGGTVAVGIAGLATSAVSVFNSGVAVSPRNAVIHVTADAEL